MTTTDQLQRVAGSERIASLDVIRGIAILFILVMNIPWMGGYEFALWDFRYPTWTSADYWTTLVTKTWLEGTQRGLLELLFGAGIMIMARHAMTPDGPVAVADLHYRRNLWLILFGLANAFVLLWPGDILLIYGIAAIFLFPFRRMGWKGQLGFAGLLFGALIWYGAADYRANAAKLAKVERVMAAEAAGKALSEDDKTLLKERREQIERRTQMPADNVQQKKKIAEADAARHGDFVSYWRYQAEGWMFLMSQFFWFIEAEVAATMLVGMALFRLGIIQGRARTSAYVALLLGGYAVGLGLRGSQWLEILRFQPGQHWQDMFGDVARLAVTLGHVGLIHLILRSAPGRALLRPFVAAGRMPLTVYLFTSLLMMWVVFAPWGLDWFGRFGMAKLALLALAVIAAELVAANLWMRRFENGPLEWLWKSLAYERRQPFRKIPREPAAAIPAAV
ncbi:DUF418 domain-containing protein [Sphingomonas mesophila]|uniref:DUF418 domain-containing protein n=1 Tax=Sphingomonas mesophila TaxID=2303576 RepID=UPI000E5839E8|nr:DUF418 domain-containing protein [Sphingomonas mesophila]